MKQSTYEAPMTECIVLNMEQRILDLSNGQSNATVENATAIEGDWE